MLIKPTNDNLESFLICEEDLGVIYATGDSADDAWFNSELEYGETSTNPRREDMVCISAMEYNRRNQMDCQSATPKFSA